MRPAGGGVAAGRRRDRRRRARLGQDDVRPRRLPRPRRDGRRSRARRSRSATATTAALPVSHLDLYRFAGVSHAEWGDLEPYFDDAVAFVEWPEAGAGVLPRAARFACACGIVAATAGRSRSSVLILAFDTATSTRDECARPRRRRCSASARRPPYACWRTSTRCWRRGNRGARARRARRRNRPRQFHGRAHGPRSRARARARARHSGRRRLDARRARGRRARRDPADRRASDASSSSSWTARSSRCPRRAFECARPRRASATARVRYREHLEADRRRRAAGRQRAAPAAGALPRAARARFRPGRSRRASLCARARRRPDARVKTAVDIRALDAHRPQLDRGDRARLLPDAVVALDVRGRAREADVALPRRVRGRPARRLPDHLALRRRVARHEHRRLTRISAGAASRRRCSLGSSS